MKKNISINISGIIFHIEEDGYDLLRKYLDSINAYFGSFEDSSEILADIEGRIAELFLSKLNEGKQVITAEDVNSLIATMGSISDFKAAQEEDFAGGADAGKSKLEDNPRPSPTQGKLFRDERRKIIAGICAGLAHYFNIDPIWPRLLFALLVFGSYGSLLILYIILWIVLPASQDLEDETGIKKMYRDSERKVLGGVAAGVAAFFGADITLVRVLFIVFGVFGIGLLVYLILWLALPEAKTITEKMQMQGEPVTLSNIESSVKKSLNENEGPHESTLAKIILFPFRMLAALINGLAKVLGPIFAFVVDALRVAAGIVITSVGFSGLLALLITGGVVLGMFDPRPWLSLGEWHLDGGSLPTEAVRNTFSAGLIFAALMASIVPCLALTLLGISVVAKRIVFNAYVGWGLFVAFFASTVFLAIAIPRLVYAFKEENEFRQEQVFAMNGKIPLLKLNEAGLDDYQVTDLMLRGYEGKDLKLVMRFEAQGASRRQAIENAQMVTYSVQQSDSVLLFDSNIVFKPGAIFRAQRLKMDLYIPLDQPFAIEPAMWRLIDNYHYRDSDYGRSEAGTRLWKFTDKGLECVGCEADVPEYSGSSSLGATDQFGLRDFDAIDLSGFFDARIEQGDDYAVSMEGGDNMRDRYRVSVEGSTLVVDYYDGPRFTWKRKWLQEDELRLRIVLPTLRQLEVAGAGKVRFDGFDEDDMEIELSGAVSGDGNIHARNLTLELRGACLLDLRGSGTFMDADMAGACSLKAYGYSVNEAVVEARGASQARVNVSHRLETEVGMASSVSHRGNPEVITRN